MWRGMPCFMPASQQGPCLSPQPLETHLCPLPHRLHPLALCCLQLAASQGKAQELVTADELRVATCVRMSIFVSVRVMLVVT